MGFPHPTPDVPGSWPHLRAEVENVVQQSVEADQLTRGLQGSTEVTPGHVCATNWVFSPDAGHLLLVQHKVVTWSIPGGHIEPHETSREGGLRELEEETGLTRYDVRSVIDRAVHVHVTDVPLPRPHRHWNIAWLYTCDRDAPLSPVEGARWFPLDDLPPGPPDLQPTAHLLRAVVIEN